MVVLGEILELVVVVIAPQPHRREDKDFPVAQTWPPVLGARLAVDIAGNGVKNRITHVGSVVDVLQAPEDGNGFVAAVEIQDNFPHRRTIQTPLTIKRFSHRLCSSKIWTCRNRFSQKIAVAAQSQFILRGAFFAIPRKFKLKSHFATDTNYPV